MGHAIGLRLQSRLKGDLDIWAIYAPSDNAHNRRKLWNTLASNMRKSALNVLVGDFNFVECNGDRFNGATHELKGQGDRPEAMELSRLVSAPARLVEIEQGMHTYIWGKIDKGVHSASRIDRVYSSIPVGWSLVQESFCDMKLWKIRSDHYPIRFGTRKIESKLDAQTPALATWVVNHKDFADRVTYHFTHNDREGTDQDKAGRETLPYETRKQVF
jgi:hypothetical protein